MPLKSIILLSINLLFFSHYSYSLTPISLDEPRPYSRLSSHIEYIGSLAEDAGIDEAISSHMQEHSQWQRYHKANADISFGIDDANYWFYFEIKNNTEPTRWLMQIALPLLDYIDIYLLRSDQPIESYQLGDHQPFRERHIIHRDFLVDFLPRSNETIQVYMRVKTAGSFQLPLSIWPQKDFRKSEQAAMLIQGSYFGAMFIMSAFVFMIYLLLKERSYLYYMLFVSFMGLLQAVMLGYGFQYVWPNSLWMQHLSVIPLLNLTLGFILLFWTDFLRLKKTWLSAHKLFLLLFSGGVTLSFLSFVLPYYASLLKITIFYSMLGMATAVVVAAKLSFSGNRSARLFLTAWNVSLLGGIIYALNKTGLIPYSIFSAYAMQIGSIIAVTLLSLAITDKINVERIEKLKAQAKALDIQKNYHKKLNLSVIERSEQLKAANLKLKEITETDALTGLKNRRHFNSYYRNKLYECLDSKQELSIAIIDIDHFKDINDSYGHSCGDDCIQHVANCLINSIEDEHIVVSRYGGEEFALTMPNKSLNEAVDICELIRKNTENLNIRMNEQKIQLTVSIGVACTGENRINDSVELINYADEALYSAKENGRNQVVAHHAR